MRLLLSIFASFTFIGVFTVHADCSQSDRCADAEARVKRALAELDKALESAERASRAWERAEERRQKLFEELGKAWNELARTTQDAFEAMAEYLELRHRWEAAAAAVTKAVNAYDRRKAEVEDPESDPEARRLKEEWDEALSEYIEFVSGDVQESFAEAKKLADSEGEYWNLLSEKYKAAWNNHEDAKKKAEDALQTFDEAMRGADAAEQALEAAKADRELCRKLRQLRGETVSFGLYWSSSEDVKHAGEERGEAVYHHLHTFTLRIVGGSKIAEWKAWDRCVGNRGWYPYNGYESWTMSKEELRGMSLQSLIAVAKATSGLQFVSE